MKPARAAEDPFVDSHGIDVRRPLLAQVAGLGDRYFTWVHEPVRRTTLRRLEEVDEGRWPGSLRIFASDRLEALTHISWRLVLAVWLPVIVALLVLAVRNVGGGGGVVAGLWVGGLVLWTLVEYVLHRFCFHTAPRGPLGIRLHFLAHGIHHYDPFDRSRLVFPIPPAVGIALALYGLSVLIWPAAVACGVMAGLLSGYLLYDMSHYASHHARVRSPWLRFLQRYHRAHHHREPDALFGVSSPLWDLVFRTGSPKI